MNSTEEYIYSEVQKRIKTISNELLLKIYKLVEQEVKSRTKENK